MRRSAQITCGCGAVWTDLRYAHCAAHGCHRSFSSAKLFDTHRSAVGEHGTCRDPATITDKHGEPLMFLRDGIWRGPELTDEERARLEASWAKQREVSDA